MHVKPNDKELKEMILNDMGTSNLDILNKFIPSWEKIHTNGT